MKAKKFCEYCIFCEPFMLNHSNDEGKGYCHRFPPVYVSRPQEVDDDDKQYADSPYGWSQPVIDFVSSWCGEFKAK